MTEQLHTTHGRGVWAVHVPMAEVKIGDVLLRHDRGYCEKTVREIDHRAGGDVRITWNDGTQGVFYRTDAPLRVVPGEKSKGHLCFSGPWEFIQVDTDIYRAPWCKHLDYSTGYRMGARFETRTFLWESYQKTHNVQPETFPHLEK